MNALKKRRNMLLFGTQSKDNNEIILDKILEIVQNGIYEPAGRGAGFGIDEQSIDELQCLIDDLGIVATKMTEGLKRAPENRAKVIGESVLNPVSLDYELNEMSPCERSNLPCEVCGKRTIDDVDYYAADVCDCITF